LAWLKDRAVSAVWRRKSRTLRQHTTGEGVGFGDGQRRAIDAADGRTSGKRGKSQQKSEQSRERSRRFARRIRERRPVGSPGKQEYRMQK